MIIVLLSFLKRNWLFTGFAMFATSALAVFCLQHLIISHLKKEVQQYRAEVLTCENSNKALVASLQSQNTAIGIMQTLSEAKVKASEKALATARAKAKKYALKAKQIQLQKNKGNSCEDITALVNEFIK